MADLSQLLVDKVPMLFGVLKAWEDELLPQERQHEEGIFLVHIRGPSTPD